METTIMENQMEKKMENEMETLGPCKGVYRDILCLLKGCIGAVQGFCGL